MKRRRPVSHALLLCVVATLVCSLAAAQDRAPVRAGTETDQHLTAPADRESFDFMIFGDRTGGPREGVDVLREAVKMANRLDVDLVMTVGDLVEGYNQPEQWLTEMSEYKGVMNGLNMPWYPTPGNHDVYARPKRPGGNTDLYKQNFGPLYYSFDYKWAHFIVLFSDEAMSFADPAKNQNFSPQQFQWLCNDIAATDAQQIFIFLHHPRWTNRYKGCNWEDVHQVLAKDGRPTWVFGGHIHLYRSDGRRDNVTYHTLATTGGELGRLTESAALHHVDFVRVRPDNATIAVFPVGNVLPGDFVLGEELETMYVLARGEWLQTAGGATISLDGGDHSQFEFTITNPADRPVRFTAEIKASYGWTIDCEPLDKELAPGESVRVTATATAPPLGDKPPTLAVEAVAHYKLNYGMVQPIDVRTDIPIDVTLPNNAGAATPDNNGVLTVDGDGAIRVDVPEQLDAYTLECWVRGTEPSGSAALITKTESSAYGIFWSDEPANPLPAGFVGTTDGYLELPAKHEWAWSAWTHLALVFDGKRGTFYVNGQPQSEKTTDANPTHNRLPLYIGADPDSRGNPSRFFTGEIDEVRLSATPRYTGAFAPQSVFTRDDGALLLLHFDQDFGGVFPDDSGAKHHGWAAGKTTIKREKR